MNETRKTRHTFNVELRLDTETGLDPKLVASRLVEPELDWLSNRWMKQIERPNAAGMRPNMATATKFAQYSSSKQGGYWVRFGVAVIGLSRMTAEKLVAEWVDRVILDPCDEQATPGSPPVTALIASVQPDGPIRAMYERRVFIAHVNFALRHRRDAPCLSVEETQWIRSLDQAEFERLFPSGGSAAAADIIIQRRENEPKGPTK